MKGMGANFLLALRQRLRAMTYGFLRKCRNNTVEKLFTKILI